MSSRNASRATLALKVALWVRRDRLAIFCSLNQDNIAPKSRRLSSYRRVQISGASSRHGLCALAVPDQPLGAADLAVNGIAFERIDHIAPEHRVLGPDHMPWLLYA